MAVCDHRIRQELTGSNTISIGPKFNTIYDIYLLLQVNLIITLSLGSMETDCVISMRLFTIEI